MALAGKCSWVKVPIYWLAQYLGAFLSSAILFGVYKGDERELTSYKFSRCYISLSRIPCSLLSLDHVV
jgi:glycerol uptake facilitator-like aquaporin